MENKIDVKKIAAQNDSDATTRDYAKSQNL